jgi:DNA-binding response OmpR family regulator
MVKKILVVDDEPDIRKTLKTILRKEGYTVITAINGEDGLKKWKEKKPDLILLDIMMEGKDGIQTLEEIRESKKETKVIMITAVDQEQTVKKTLKLNAKGFILKPFNISKVLKKVKEVLNKPRSS